MKEFKNIEMLLRNRWELIATRGFSKASFFFLLFSFLCMSSFAQVTSKVDTTTIRIGEEIKYTIEVEADSTALVLFPEGQSFSPLEVIDSYKVDTTYAQQRVRLIKRYGLTQFDSGRYKLPSQRVVINEKAFMTDSASVEVRDVAVDTTKQKMFDIKPAFEVVDPPFNFVNVLYWLLPLVILGLIIFLFFRRKKRKLEREKQLPPYEEAMFALEQLDEVDYLTQNKAKEYYSQLTEIIKRYLGREVDDTAQESTSDELIERLRLLKDSGHFEFDTSTIKRLDAIFKRADLVKFARAGQESGQARADRSTIEEIINETKEVIPEPTEEELLENEAYLERLQKKRQRKRILIGASSLVLLAIIGAVIYGSVTTFDNLKDKVIGNEMRSLEEGRWYKSEYGLPSVTIETPEILTRTEIEIPEEMKSVILSQGQFEYGDFKNAFHIMVNTAVYNPQVLESPSFDLDRLVEQALQNIEKIGATNMIVKKEPFSTDGGIEGIRAHGDFNIKFQNGKLSGEKAAYEVLLFKHKKGVQLISVVYQKEDFHALSIKERIINSVELEVDESQKSNQQEEN